MHPNRKTTRPQNPPLTRRQLDQLVGEAVTRHLLLDARTHYEDRDAEALVRDVLELLPTAPDYHPPGPAAGGGDRGTGEGSPD